MFRKGKRETVWRNHVAQHYGLGVAGALQWGVPGNMAYDARCKRVAVLRAWTEGMPIAEIETTFTVNPFYRIGAGDIRGFADIARFHLGAAFEISDILLLGQGPSAEDVERLLAQLETGIPAAALGLLDFQVTLGRGAYLALHQAGLSNPTDIWAAGEERLRALVGNAIATSLLAEQPSEASATAAARVSDGG